MNPIGAHRGRTGQMAFTRLALAALVAAVIVVPLGGCGRSLSSSCREVSPRSVANENIRFLGLVQEAGIPDSVAGERLDDPLGCAYLMLCERVRNTVSESEFRQTRGTAVSEVLAADSVQGPSVYQPDLDLQEVRVSEDLATIDFEASFFEHIDEVTVVTDSEVIERWQTELVREDGQWKVCGFERLPD